MGIGIDVGDDRSTTSEETSSFVAGEMDSREGIDGIERVALSFGLSIAIVPLIGLALNFTPWGIRLVPIMIATTGFTLRGGHRDDTALASATGGPVFRPYREWYETGRSEMLEPESRADGLLNVLLVLSILLAVGSVTFAAVVPAGRTVLRGVHPDRRRRRRPRR